MSDLNLNQLVNLAYVGTVVLVEFKTPKIYALSGETAEETPQPLAAAFTDFYKSQAKQLYSFLCKQEVEVGDLVLVPVQHASNTVLKVAEVKEIASEESLDLAYQEKYAYVIAVIPEETLQDYWFNIADQINKEEEIKTVRAKNLRASLRAALLANGTLPAPVQLTREE